MAVKEMERKVTKVGNSLGVTMTDALEQIGVSLGDTVRVEVQDGKIMIEKSRAFQVPEGLNPKFFEGLQYIYKNYDETLKGLKDR